MIEFAAKIGVEGEIGDVEDFDAAIEDLRAALAGSVSDTDREPER